ncbi:nucleotide-binding protein [Candidatus Woesearchaeota archaeon]|nr:nucleotide-binding protein [Candidatus Woesearchaeota archaeon]
MPAKILLDTNFMLIPGQFGVDIFEEINRICIFSHEPVILEESLKELDGIIMGQKGKDKAAAKLAIELIKKKGIMTLKTATFKNVDKTILELAPKEGLIVATQDKELRHELKKLGVRTIVLMQKKYLKLE